MKSNLVFYCLTILFGFLLNLRLLNNDYFNLGMFIFVLLICIIGLKLFESVFKRIILGSLCILFGILIIGEILYLNGIKSFIFDTVEYNWYFWVQVSYIIIIAPVIGLYYEKKLKEHRY